MEVTVSVVDPDWKSVNSQHHLQPEDSPGHTSCRWTSNLHPLQLWIVELHQGNHTTWIWDVMVLQGRYLQHHLLRQDQGETNCAVLSQ